MRRLLGAVLCAVLWAITFVDSSHAQSVAAGPLLTVVSYRHAKVWIKTQDPGVEVKVVYSFDPGFPLLGTYNSSEITTSTASDNTAILDIQPPVAVAEDQVLYYAVYLNGDPAGAVHQFRFMKPLTSSNSFKFVMMADVQDEQRTPSEQVPSYNSIATDAPRFAVFLGDLDHRNPQFVSTRRGMYLDHRTSLTPAGDQFATQFINPQPSINQIPILYMWDNHDFGGGDKYSTNRCDAWQVFREYWPTPTLSSSPPSCVTAPNEVGMWYKFQCGKCDFIVLDCRSQKDPGAGTMLGETQRTWFKNRLLEGKARQWIFVLSTVSFNPTVKAGIPFTTSQALGMGSWGAFEAERNEIVDYMTSNNICNVVWITGDVHSGGAADDAHTGHSSGGTYTAGRPEFSIPHLNLAHQQHTTLECTDDPDAGDSGFERVGYDSQTMKCMVGGNASGLWKYGSVDGLYVSGYGTELGDVASKPAGDTYLDGGEGYLLVEVNGSNVTFFAKDKNGYTKTLGSGGPALCWTVSSCNY